MSDLCRLSISQRLGSPLDQTIATYPFPPVYRLVQKPSQPFISDASAAVADSLRQPEIRARLERGARICLAVGSRGITGIATIVRALCDQLKDAGTSPFIIPAMGSHGGATPEGQKSVLARMGITEESCGVPIVASMETVTIGVTSEQVPVHFSRDAIEADAVIPVGRIKSHTGFRGPIESGLMKMMVVGMGKSRGAEQLHAVGMHRFPKLIPAAGSVVLQTQQVAFGLAIVENGDGSLAKIEAVLPHQIEEREKELLKLAKALSIGLPFDRLDVLVVRDMGKDISGSGMDPNVTGRFTRSAGFSSRPNVQVIAVLSLTEGSKGNAVGIGLADVITERLTHQVDWPATYTNAMTAFNVTSAMLPIVMENDRTCIAASAILSRTPPDKLRMAFIASTLDLTELWITPALVAEVAAKPGLFCDSKSIEVPFHDDGRLSLDFPRNRRATHSEDVLN